MRRRTRILVAVLLVYATGIGFLLHHVLADIDPRYRESAEDALVETSQLLAILVEQDLRGGAIETARLEPLFREVHARRFSAQIYDVQKDRVELRAYVTDATGRVLFDSLGRDVGADFSNWRDVALALRGDYGARTTRDNANDPASGVMYVAAPIRWNGRIVGTATVGKPERSFGRFAQAARSKTLYVGLLAASAVLLLAVIVSVWLVRPFGLVVDYARYVRAERKLSLRRLARRAGGAVVAAYEEMHDVLAGRSHAAGYVQTLTHEIKSPLSAIKGAAELLQDPGMESPERARFLRNIATEADRIQEIVDRMMELTALERRRSLDGAEPVPLAPLLEELAATARATAAPRSIRIELQVETNAVVEGDSFLLRRAVGNLIDNAIDFSPAGGIVRLTLATTRGMARIAVRDEGPGIPAYAQGRVFEKFYSLARPASGRKSTGLGLSFVQEIAALHHGRIELASAPQGGTLARLSLPCVGG